MSDRIRVDVELMRTQFETIRNDVDQLQVQVSELEEELRMIKKYLKDNFNVDWKYQKNMIKYQRWCE